jgi:hypothetical protein
LGRDCLRGMGHNRDEGKEGSGGSFLLMMLIFCLILRWCGGSVEVILV